LTSPIRNIKDFLTGFIYIVIGLSAIIIARDYGMGTTRKMGPAYFPTVLSVLLILVGIISLVRSFIKQGSPVGKVAFKGLLLVTVSTVFFGLILRSAGLIIAIPVFVVGSSYASRLFHWRYSLILAAGLTVFCVLIFLKGLGLPIPIIGPWFGR